MEIFRKAFECALAHEKNKTANRTRRTYRKQITVLEKTIVDLKSVIVTKDSDIASMGQTIDTLNTHLGIKKSEIEGLENELRDVKTALEDKDKMHSKVLQKFSVQSNLFSTTRKQLEQVTKENEDQSNQIWKMLEENCFLNKRILELDLEVHTLEVLLSKLKINLEKAEQRATRLGQNFKHAQEGYEVKSREVLDISTREKQLRATVLNLQSELEQFKRSAQVMSTYTTSLKHANGITSHDISQLHHPQIPSAVAMPNISMQASGVPLFNLPGPLTPQTSIESTSIKSTSIETTSTETTSTETTSTGTISTLKGDVHHSFVVGSAPGLAAAFTCNSALNGPSVSPVASSSSFLSPPTSSSETVVAHSTPHSSHPLSPLLTPLTPSVLSFHSSQLHIPSTSVKLTDTSSTSPSSTSPSKN